MSDWQSIETAPTDGTKILLAYGGHVEIGAHTTVEKFKGGHPWRSGSAYGRVLWAAPTHWMPLPASPPHSPAGTEHEAKV